MREPLDTSGAALRGPVLRFVGNPRASGGIVRSPGGEESPLVWAAWAVILVLRKRLYDVLLDAVPHLAAEKQLFRAVSTVLGAVIEYHASIQKRS